MIFKRLQLAACELSQVPTRRMRTFILVSARWFAACVMPAYPSSQAFFSRQLAFSMANLAIKCQGISPVHNEYIWMALFLSLLLQFSAAHLHVALHKMFFVITGRKSAKQGTAEMRKNKGGSCIRIRTRTRIRIWIRKNVNKLNVIPFNFGAVLKSSQDSILPPIRPSHLQPSPPSGTWQAVVGQIARMKLPASCMPRAMKLSCKLQDLLSSFATFSGGLSHSRGTHAKGLGSVFVETSTRSCRFSQLLGCSRIMSR